jgi:hypothetical protein
MSVAKGLIRTGLLMLAVALHLACGDGALPGAPSVEGVATDGDGPVGVLDNSPPEMNLRTTPPAVPGDPYPVISGSAPLTVRFNLCRSEDPDQAEDGSGDSLNWQFHFGDDGTPPFNPDGTFNANFARQCRAEHTYGEGTYVATVSVTDKHLEDQSDGVANLARVTQRLTVSVGPTVPRSNLSKSQSVTGAVPATLNNQDVWSIHAPRPGTTVTVTVDTVSAATAFDPELCISTTTSSASCFVSADDNVPCTFPPPAFACPTITTTLPSVATYYILVESGSNNLNFAGATGNYVLSVTSDPAVGKLTLEASGLPGTFARKVIRAGGL